MMIGSNRALVLFIALLLISSTASAKRRRARRYQGPPPTHPVVLWARTLGESPDLEARKVAAFKLSQYSQTIFQVEAVNALIACTRHTDLQLRVLCTKALARAGNSSKKAQIESTLLEIFDSEPKLRCTVIRAMTVRGDNTPIVTEKFLGVARETKNAEELLALLTYFETLGPTSPRLIPAMAEIYAKTTDEKIRRAIAKVIAAHGNGTEPALDLLSKCGSSNNDTPLTLICLGGLQQQGKNDPRTWMAVEKALESDDPDVQLAVVDLIISLSDNPSFKLTERLISILEDADDDDLQEKIVLSLGVVGDKTEKISQALAKLIQNAEAFEGARIASALTITKQSPSQELAKESLSKCLTDEKSETLRSACQLGVNELSTRAVASPGK